MKESTEQANYPAVLAQSEQANLHLKYNIGQSLSTPEHVQLCIQRDPKKI
jgi:hypothetical protein